MGAFTEIFSLGFYLLYPIGIVIPLSIALALILFLYLKAANKLSKLWWIPLGIFVLAIVIYVIIRNYVRPNIELFFNGFHF